MKTNFTKQQMIHIYNGYIQSLMEYAAPVFVGLTKHDSNRLNKIQNHAHHIICGWDCHCNTLDNLDDQRLSLTKKLFYKVYNNELNILQKYCPDHLPKPHKFHFPFCQTERKLHSFFPFIIKQINNG